MTKKTDRPEEGAQSEDLCGLACSQVDTTDIPRPSFIRRLRIPGLVYFGETEEQAKERERLDCIEDARIAAEEERLWRWKITPWWEL